MAFLLALQGAVAQGSLWAILALGTYVTFRILKITDMTVDGSFATGACVGAVVLVAGAPPLLALPAAFISGMLAGAITGLLHTKLGIPDVLSGILTQFGLYSINLRILGKANQQLLQVDTLFNQIQELFAGMGIDLSMDQVGLILGFLLLALVIGIMYWFFGTEIGAAIRATGNNEAMVRAQGQNTDTTKMIGLIFANALIALSGSLVAMFQGAADVGMGAGSIVIGLASIVIGEVVFPRANSFVTRMLSVVVGSILYRVIVAFVLQLGLNTNDLKLLTAVIVALALSLPKLRQSSRKKEGGRA